MSDDANGNASGSATRSTRRSPDKETRSRHKKWAWGLGIFSMIVPAIALIGIIAFAVTYTFATVPQPGELKQNQVATIVDNAGNTIARVVPPEGNRTDVPIEEIPESIQYAVIAAEDREFETNPGFSIRGLSRAAIGQITNNPGAGGGSTITQQYVKNALVGDEASYERKFRELVLATKMAKQWDKDEIMAAYLNTIYFGRGAYGVSSAAQAYFRKPVQEINVAEAAVLASVIRSPSYYAPESNLAELERRWDYVLDGMVEIGRLTPSDRAATEFPQIPEERQTSGETPGPNGLIRRQVLQELESIDGVSEEQMRTGGLRVTTSIDPQVQNSVVQAACRQNSVYPCDNGILNGEPEDLRDAVVSIDPRTGGVRGYYGGDDGQGWDYAQAGLQTGSSFKVFALVAALEQGIGLSTVYSSAPFQQGSVEIGNASGESCGSCNLATAMKMSLNTVYYRLMMDLDGQAQAVAEAAHKAGVAESFGNIQQTLQEENGLPEGGVVLGQYPSRVIDMASAYATLAASGIYRAPYFIEKVETANGDVLFEREQNEGERVFPARVADNVTAALEPIAAYSNGNSLFDSNLGSRPSAAKTGTAQLGETGQNKDAWMVGYTPSLSTAVWVGTDSGGPLTTYSGASVYGSGLPSQIWKRAMDNALDGRDIEQFPTPESVGGQAGVPYEPPATTNAPQTSQRPDDDEDRDRPRPGDEGDGNLTLAPGITIPIPGAPQQPPPNNGGQNGGNPPGDDGGEGGDVPEPPTG